MKLPNLKGAMRGIGMFTSKHTPEILTAIGITGMVTTTILAVKATPKALQKIENTKDEINMHLAMEAQENGEDSIAIVDKLKPIDVVKVTWKLYIPAAVTCVASTACLIGASSVNMRRNAALAAAYTLSERTLAEFKEKTKEVVGEETAKTIQEKVVEDKIKANPAGNEVHIVKEGGTLCYDVYSSRWFTSEPEKLKRAENVINKQMLRDGYISLNELYDEIGLAPTQQGSALGWKLDDGMIELYFGSMLTEDDKPVLVVEFNSPPKYKFDSLV